MSVSCTAPLEPPAPIDGGCGGANGVPTLVKPQSGLCASGITGVVNGRGPWTWTCSGANGGTPASCVAPVAGKSAPLPSTMTTSDSDMPAPASSPSGLVTPHLANSNGTTPALDKKALPSLSSFATPPTPSHVPPSASVNGVEAPLETPTLPAGSQPVTPPSVAIAPAPALQEDDEQQAALDKMQRTANIPGNHLELDPTISTVLFPRGSGNIADNVLVTLDKLANVLSANPDVRIALTAYADNTGSTPRDARKLSLTRALAVRDYLVSKGIAESRVDIHAEGSNTASGYIDRVDVKVID
jgi:outer membrane protein OmpA-like peptidoglycan-associated protein